MVDPRIMTFWEFFHNFYNVDPWKLIPAAALLGIAAVLLGRTVPLRIWVLLGYLFGSLMVYYGLRFHDHDPRLILFGLAGGVAVQAFLIEWLVGRWEGNRSLVLGGTAVYLWVGLSPIWPFTPDHFKADLTTFQSQLAFISGKMTKEKFLDKGLALFPALDYVNRNIAEGAVVGVVNDYRLYYSKAPFVRLNALLKSRVLPLETEEELKLFLASNHVQYVMENHDRELFDLGFVNTFIDASNLNVIKPVLAELGVLEYYKNHRSVYRIVQDTDPAPPVPYSPSEASGLIKNAEVLLDGEPWESRNPFPLLDGRVGRKNSYLDDWRLGRIVEVRFPGPSVRLDRLVLLRQVSRETDRKAGDLQGADVFLSGDGVRFQTRIFSPVPSEENPGLNRWEIRVGYTPVRAFRIILKSDPAVRIRVDEMEIYGRPL